VGGWWLMWLGRVGAAATFQDFLGLRRAMGREKAQCNEAIPNTDANAGK